MNVLQRPREKEFCATMRDYIIDTDVTITFAVKYGGKTILDEEYVPDANNQVRVRKLGKFCELALWGVWCAGETSWQTDADKWCSGWAELRDVQPHADEEGCGCAWLVE